MTLPAAPRAFTGWRQAGEGAGILKDAGPQDSMSYLLMPFSQPSVVQSGTWELLLNNEGP